MTPVEAVTNSHLPGFDNAVLWVVVALAAYAAVVNWRAWKYGLPTFRVIRGVTSVLAAVYVVAYVVLLVGNVNPVGWSSVIRGIGLIVWPVVWIAPARIGIQRWHDYTAAVEVHRQGDE